MQSETTRTVILATGGTIAGAASGPDESLAYRAGAIGIEALIDAVPPLARWPIEHETVAAVDSRDMTPAIWRRLAQRAAQHLARPEVGGVVVTHGTDTLEETAYLLHRVLAPASKPLVLTAAMRPATALSADGPRNLLDAVRVAREPGARGVLAVLDARVFAGAELRKRHTLRVDAFGGGDGGPLATIEGEVLRRWRDWPAAGESSGVERLPADDADWPWVAVLSSHAGADGREVAALRAAGVRGIVVAGTGHGTLAAPLARALADAQAAGLPVTRCSRCADGPVLDASAGRGMGGPEGPEERAAPALPAGGSLSPWQARIELQLALLAARGAVRRS